MTTRTEAATTTATLNSFTMNCQVGESSWNKTFTKTDNTWSTFVWPVSDDTKLDFYAHNADNENAFMCFSFFVSKCNKITPKSR